MLLEDNVFVGNYAIEIEENDYGRTVIVYGTLLF